MFIRQKKRNGRVYHYVVSSHRCGAQVKQTIQAYLGSHASIEDAIAELERKVRVLQARRELLYGRYFGPKPPEVHREPDRSYRQEEVFKQQVSRLCMLSKRM